MEMVQGGKVLVCICICYGVVHLLLIHYFYFVIEGILYL